jgi:thiamine biosynthesis lipoprotein
MGAKVEITTDASDITVAAALALVRSLERRWSRFRSESELSRLNAAGGPAVARPSTARVIEVALAGSRLTRGWFDPTRGADLAAAGYHRSLENGWGVPRRPAPRQGAVSIDSDTGLVDVPRGVDLDLGGIAKGWTADIVTAFLRDGDAEHSGVAVGGDVRVISDTRVLVEIAAPDQSTDRPAIIGLRDGGVAVSGATRRQAGDGRHHLIDPFTGEPARQPRIAAVVAATAAGAEMVATAAAIAPLDEAIAIIESLGATAWLAERDGTRTTVGCPDKFLLDAGWLA